MFDSDEEYNKRYDQSRQGRSSRFEETKWEEPEEPKPNPYNRGKLINDDEILGLETPDGFYELDQKFAELEDLGEDDLMARLNNIGSSAETFDEVKARADAAGVPIGYKSAA